MGDIQISAGMVQKASPLKHQEELRTKRQQARGFHQLPISAELKFDSFHDAMNQFMNMFRPSLADGTRKRLPFDGLLDGMLSRWGPQPQSPGHQAAPAGVNHAMSGSVHQEPQVPAYDDTLPPSVRNQGSKPKDIFDMAKSMFAQPDFAAPLRTTYRDNDLTADVDKS